VDLLEIRNFGIALLIGALVGIEREKRRAAKDDPGIGGIRTFILLSQAGAVAAWITIHLATPWVFVGGLLAVSAALVASHILEGRGLTGTPGLTTEVAAVVVYLLAGLPLFGYPELAVALAIFTSALLAFKQPIHGLVEKIGTEDLYAVLKLLIATFIVLPLLPDRAIDPLGAFNPYQIWFLVVLLSGLSLVGYVAVRAFGEGHGVLLTGLTGGVVSSTAVTLHFARQSRAREGSEALAGLFVSGTLVAWTVMFVRILVAVAIVNASLLADLLVPFGAVAAVTLGFAGFHYFTSSRRLQDRRRAADSLEVKNPFSLTSAMKFALLFAAVLVAVAVVRRYAPPAGLYLVAGVAGLTDVDAITLTMANDARQTGLVATAVNAMVIAALANTLAKLGFFLMAGTRAARRPLAVATLAIVLAGGLSLLLRS
jgi:uncharacterized membrane protein (DUF4010 family)